MENKDKLKTSVFYRSTKHQFLRLQSYKVANLVHHAILKSAKIEKIQEAFLKIWLA